MTLPQAPPSPHVGSGASRVRPDEVLGVLSLGALVLAVWPALLPAVGMVRAGAPLDLTVLTAHLSGMLAGYGVVVLLLLMSRTPALEEGVGADRLARWHSMGGRLVVSLAVVHASAAVLAWARSRQENVLLAWWHVLHLPWLMAATVGTCLLLVVAALSIRAARSRVSYEVWHGIHLLVYLAVALTFVHQLAGPDLTGHRVLQVAWSLMYCLVFALVLIHRFLVPLRTAGRHRMRVAAVHPEGPGVVSVVVSGQHLAELSAQPGQFFRWRFLTPDLWLTAHPFSLSAPPTDTELRLTVKTLGDGTSRLQRLEVGTWVIAEGPYGAMTAERRTRRNVLLVAGGVGITPMRALFETMPRKAGQDLLLLYRARTEQDLLFRAELEQIARERGVRVLFEVDDDQPPLSAAHLQSVCPDVAGRDVYFCGPPPMGAALRTACRDAGLPAGHLHEERFSF